MATTTYVELDSRKRVNLAKIATAQSYLVTAESDGRIILEPAVVMTATEAALLADPRIREMYEESLADRAPRSPRPARRERDERP